MIINIDVLISIGKATFRSGFMAISSVLEVVCETTCFDRVRGVVKAAKTDSKITPIPNEKSGIKWVS